MAKKNLYKLFCLSALQVTLVHAEQPMPGIEFLEYLAEMENSDGEWIDPLYMKELARNDHEDEFTQEQGDE